MECMNTLRTGPLVWSVECTPVVRNTKVQSQVESYQGLKKWYLLPPWLTLSIIRHKSRESEVIQGKE